MANRAVRRAASRQPRARLVPSRVADDHGPGSVYESVIEMVGPAVDRLVDASRRAIRAADDPDRLSEDLADLFADAAERIRNTEGNPH